MRRAASERSGFTAIELMMVVAVIALAAYSVGLGLDTLVPGERMNTSVRRLASAVKELRSDAIARSSPFYLEYDLENERYRVHTSLREGGGLQVSEAEEAEEHVVLSWEQLEPGVDLASIQVAGELFTQGSVLVRFDPLGAVSDHSVVLRQPEFDRYFTIEVLSLTGVIQFHDGIYLREAPQEEDFQ